MTTVSKEAATLLIQIAFLVGAVTDGLAIIPMLSYRVGVWLFGGGSSRNSYEYRYAMGMGASLMAGWTFLLLWGVVNPIERREILLLTVFPVITGIVLATVFAVRHRVIRFSRAIPLWIHLGIVSLLYGVSYIVSIPFAD